VHLVEKRSSRNTRDERQQSFRIYCQRSQGLSTTTTMAMAPSNNPMRADEGELWGEEPIVTSSASAPAFHETPRYVRRDPSRDREREESFRDHPRSSSTEKREQFHRSETQPLSSTRTYFGEDPSMVSAKNLQERHE
jgi:hypothetical protein